MSAAPTIPALLAIEATAISTPASNNGTQRSGFLLAPPPRMINSGENSLTTTRR
jgi:hypothetical protein